MKLLSLLFSSLIILTPTIGSTLSAAEYFQDNCCPQSCCPENCCSDDTSNYNLNFDYLFWRVTQDQMPYALYAPNLLQKINTDFDIDNGIILNQTIKIVEPSFDWKSGFRLGASSYCGCDYGVNLSWTHFNESQNSSVRDKDGNVFPSAFPITGILALVADDPYDDNDVVARFLDKAKSNWSFKFDTIDLQLGKACICSNMKVQPYVGLKAASILQHQKIQYFGIDINGFTLIDKVKKANHFRGIGPSVGVNAVWDFCKNWSLSTGVGGAWVYGKFDSSIRNNLNPVFPVVDPTGESLGLDVAVRVKANKRNRLRPTANANFGVDWSSESCGCWPITLGVSYEVQYWWNQWQVPYSLENTILNASSTQGDLMMQGVTFHASVAF